MAREAEIKITVDSNQARRQLDQLDRSLVKTDKASKKTGANIAALGKKFALGAVAVLAAATALAKFTKQALDTADEIGKTATKLGIATDALQELRLGAELSGLEVQQLDTALGIFAKNINDADKGTGLLRDTLIKMGVAVRDTEGRMRPLEEILADFADGVKAADTDLEKFGLAADAFGARGAAMVNMLRNGSEGLEAFSKAAQDNGLILEEESIRKAEQLNDKLTVLWGTISTKLTGSLVELGVAFSNLFTEDDIVFNAFETAEAATRAQIQAVEDLAVAEAALAEPRKRGNRQQNREQDKLRAGLRNEIETLKELIPLYGRQAAELEASGKTEQAEQAAAVAAAETSVTNALLAQAEARAKLFPEEAKWLALQKEVQAALEKKAITQEEANAILLRNKPLTEAQIEEQGRFIQSVNETNEAMKKAGTTSTDVTDKMTAEQIALAGAVSDTSAAMADSLVEFALTGEQAFGDMVEAILKDLAKLIVQAQITRAITAAFPGLTASADGNAFAGGNVLPFAKGGVVDSPTLFPMANGAGLMGEAGPEAILPLSRGKDGKLGVASSGGGGGVTVNVINQGAENEVDVKTSQDGMTIDVLITQKVNAALGNGSLDKSLGNSFGLSRRGR